MSVDAEAARDHLGVDGVAGVGVGGEHLAGDLGVARLVGADEAELVAAEDGDEAVEQEEDGDGEEDDEFAHGGRGRAAAAAKPEDGCVLVPCA